MIKRLAAFLTLALCASLPASASIALSIDAGLLTSSSGTANPIANGDLILVIASTNGIFTPTGPGQFVSGNNLILGSSTAGVTGAFAMDSGSSGGVAGEDIKTFTFDLGVGATGTSTFSSTSIVAGDALAIRWYDNFTYAQFLAGQTPTSGDYGTYTTLVTPDGGASWVIPADNSIDTGNLGLFFFTQSDQGSSLNIQGQALTPVVSGSVAVPEPSTYALLATGLLFVAGMAVRKKRLAVVTK